MAGFYEVFPKEKVIIGMVHLKALPGSCGFDGDLGKIYEYALRDLKALEEGGAHGAIIENFSDVPYTTTSPLETLTAMTAIVARLRQETVIPLGVNFQFNCAREEMAIAYTCGAEFIRVEAFVENRVGPFGLTLAQGPELMRYRAQLNADVLIFADINVKHTYPMVPQDISLNLAEAVASGAHAVIVTGAMTGKNPSPEEVKLVKQQVSNTPVLVGSGVSADNIREFMKWADGVIVGSSIKYEGRVENPVDPERVRKLVDLSSRDD